MINPNQDIGLQIWVWIIIIGVIVFIFKIIGSIFERIMVSKLSKEDQEAYWEEKRAKEEKKRLEEEAKEAERKLAQRQQEIAREENEYLNRITRIIDGMGENEVEKFAKEHNFSARDSIHLESEIRQCVENKNYSWHLFNYVNSSKDLYDRYFY